MAEMRNNFPFGQFRKVIGHPISQFMDREQEGGVTKFDFYPLVGWTLVTVITYTNV